jgi:hypothetical protein
MSHQSLDQTIRPVIIEMWPAAQVHMAGSFTGHYRSRRSCSVQEAATYRCGVETRPMVCRESANTVLEQGYGLNRPAVEHTYRCSCGQKSDLFPPLLAHYTRQTSAMHPES